ncbi:hypothetical protein ABVT39_023730 [Epinephelus coioides]
MRKTAGPPACRGPDSFLSSYGPITLLYADARAAVMPRPMEPLVCCIRTVKNVDSRCGKMVPFLFVKSSSYFASNYSDVVLL